MKKPVVALTFLLFATVAIAQTTDSDPVVIRIGETEVHRSEFEAMIESLPPEYRAYLQEPGGMRSFAENFVEMKVLAIEAEKRGVADEPAVATQLRLTRDNALASAMVARVEENIQPTADEITSRYEAKKSEYEQVSARHILIAFEGSPASRPDRTRTEDEAKTLAEKLRADIVGGGDFAEIAKTESDDTFSGEKGGDLGAFGRGQMVPEFENAVFNGKIGELAELVRTQFGYHIIEVTDHSSMALAEVSEEIRSELVREILQKQLAEMASKFDITYVDEYFAPAEAQPNDDGTESSGGER